MTAGAIMHPMPPKRNRLPPRKLFSFRTFRLQPYAGCFHIHHSMAIFACYTGAIEQGKGQRTPCVFPARCTGSGMRKPGSLSPIPPFFPCRRRAVVVSCPPFFLQAFFLPLFSVCSPLRHSSAIPVCYTSIVDKTQCAAKAGEKGSLRKRCGLAEPTERRFFHGSFPFFPRRVPSAFGRDNQPSRLCRVSFPDRAVSDFLQDTARFFVVFPAPHPVSSP